MANSFCFRVFASCAVESSLTHRMRDELHRHGCDRIDMIDIHRRCFIESVGLADLRIAATTHRRFQSASPWPDFEPPSPASSRKADNEARWNRKGVRHANRCSRQSHIGRHGAEPNRPRSTIRWVFGGCANLSLPTIGPCRRCRSFRIASCQGSLAQADVRFAASRCWLPTELITRRGQSRQSARGALLSIWRRGIKASEV